MNRARSPLAAALFAREANARAHRLQVDSAGTHASPGQPALGAAQNLAAKWGLDLGRHQSQQLRGPLLPGTDLVVTMTEDQRATVISLDPNMSTRTFTLAEAVRLAGGEPLPETVREAVTELHRRKPRRPAPLWSGDITDPVGSAPGEFHRILDEMHGLVLRLSSLLFRRPAQP